MKKRWGSGVLTALILLAFVLTGCERVLPNYFAYREGDFSAEIEGEINGVPFAALISAEATADGSGRRLSVSYFHSDVLDGIKVEVYPDGTASLTQGTLVFSSDRAALSGLISPLELLLTESEPLAVRREGDLTVVTLQDQTSLTLSKELIPVSLASPTVAFDVIWWEAGVGEC